jgi:superfamily II DNA or RNA helicase
MSKKCLLSALSNEEVETITSELVLSQEPSKYAYNNNPTQIPLYEFTDDSVIVPFSFPNDSLKDKFARPERSTLEGTSVSCNIDLRDEQKAVKEEALNNLNRFGATIIACYPGFGKTALAIYLSTKIKLKTLILCHRVVLLKQWKEAIETFCPEGKVDILTAKTKSVNNFDFCIANAVNIPKMGINLDFGLVIVDECHIIMAEKMSQCMKYLFPRYLLGLSATPYRVDGLNKLLDMYFGTQRIERKLYRQHTVYRVHTGFKPGVELDWRGKVNWNSVINSVCSNRERNELIIDILKSFCERTFLVLCKRVEQANYIIARLEEEKEDVTNLVGKNQEFNLTSRILVGTTGKIGVGFNHPRLDTLLLASDVEQYFVQYLGRVFRREDVEPIIFDLIDDFGLLHKHFKTRCNVYLEHGGVIKQFDLNRLH